MFERFTERARQVVVQAQETAREYKHAYIGTEHILMGLLREEEGLGARVLESLDVTEQLVRREITRQDEGDDIEEREAISGQIPFTPRAKRVLELSLREALTLGHNYIGTEHILLGLVRENEGVAARILLDLDADSEKIRNEVIRMLSGPGGRRPKVLPEKPTLAEQIAEVRAGVQRALTAQEFEKAAELRSRQRHLEDLLEEHAALVADAHEYELATVGTSIKGIVGPNKVVILENGDTIALAANAAVRFGNLVEVTITREQT